MDRKLINILVRTHRRPQSFKRLMDSICSQTYKDVRLYVSYDDDLTKKYVYEYFTKNNIDNFKAIGVSADRSSRTFYNLYFNDLIAQVEDGYIFCIDDDDYLSSDNALQMIADNLDRHIMLLFRMKVGGSLYPSGSHFGGKPILSTI